MQFQQMTSTNQNGKTLDLLVKMHLDIDIFPTQGGKLMTCRIFEINLVILEM
jgi:hypothetical protein